MNADSSFSLILLLLSIAFALVIYWLPTIVATRRKVHNSGSIVIVNLFLGWTLIGWVVAMAMALRDAP